MEDERKVTWIKYLTVMKSMRHIFTVFDGHKDVVVREAKVKFAVFMFCIKFKRWEFKKRPTYAERLRVNAKQ